MKIFRKRYSTKAAPKVRLVDMMPYKPDGPLKCDQRIVEAARISYGKTTSNVKRDKQLVRYLVRKRHTSPLEMVEFVFHVKAPLFVVQQWLRHRTFSYNQISARYTQINHEFYVPPQDDVRGQSTVNHQGSSGLVNRETAEAFAEICKADTPYNLYEQFLEDGVAREQARMILPQNMMTEFFVKGNLHNWLHFIKLRKSGDAQSEIREYAQEIYDHISHWCPVSTKAFEEYVLESMTLSKREIEAIRSDTIIIDRSKGEQRDFMKKLKRLNLMSHE